MRHITFEVYDSEICEMLDIIISGIQKQRISSETQKQWILRHLFLDIFEYAREFLLVTVYCYSDIFKIKPKPSINLVDLLNQINQNEEKISNDFINACKGFKDLRNHLSHRLGYYYSYDDKKTRDLEVTFPACEPSYLSLLKPKPQLKGRLNKIESTFTYGEPIKLKGYHIANLILYLRIQMYKLFKEFKVGDIEREEEVNPSILEKLKYIYDTV